jgi:predicted naringenin-chalcone synthase
MSFTILGLGTALPPGVVTQDEAAKCARLLAGPDVRNASWLPAVYSHSGIQTRHQILGRPLVEDLLAGTRTCGSPFLPDPARDGTGPSTAERMAMYAESAPPLAVEASAKALAESGIDPASVTQLVTVSCTGFIAPGVDFALIRGLGLPPTVERTHVGFMGCHGALNGLRVANAYAADPAARVLLCAVELCSLHYHTGNDAEKAVANAIFADGAAAVVGTAATPLGSPLNAAWSVKATGSCLIPDSAEAMGWAVGDYGFEMTLSRRIPALIARNVRPWLDAWLGRHGLTVETVGSWAVHPGGPKILTAVEEGLSLPPDALATSRAVYAACGNMSSPTVLFVIDRLRRANAARPCVALGFGPGLMAEAVLWA